MFQVVPPHDERLVARLQRPSVFGQRERGIVEWVLFLLQQGEGCKQQEGGRVIGTSRANEGGFWWIPHRHSPAGAYPATQVRP